MITYKPFIPLYHGPIVSVPGKSVQQSFYLIDLSLSLYKLSQVSQSSGMLKVTRLGQISTENVFSLSQNGIWNSSNLNFCLYCIEKKWATFVIKKYRIRIESNITITQVSDWL